MLANDPLLELGDAAGRRMEHGAELVVALDSALPAIGRGDRDLVHAGDEPVADDSISEGPYPVGRPGDDDLDDLERALTALRGVGTPARVAAATIEKVGGRTVGRARLLLPEGTDRRAAEEHLRGAGVTVEEVAR